VSHNFFLFFTEKELFQLSGYINGQHNRVWSAKNPQALHKNPQHLSATGIWCAGSRRRIAGSLFFEETITAENYQNLVTQFIVLQEDSWFRQAGANAHKANRTSFLHVHTFSDGITWREILAPPSSNFMLFDSILWEFLKERVYSNNPRILEDLNDNTEQFVAGPDQKILRKVAGSTAKMANVCLREGMERFQNLL
jgi:hypothetical protein